MSKVSAFKELVERATRGGADAGQLSRDECLRATREFAKERRAEIRSRHDEGESGGQIAKMLSDTADVIVSGVYYFGVALLNVPRASLSRTCLCALGGYGRGVLNPYSDLDVCFLYEGGISDPIKRLNQFVMPFLWDSGFIVGYGIRSVNEARKLSSEDPEVFTSYLESRLVCGESSVFARMKMLIGDLKPKILSQGYVDARIHSRFEGLSDSENHLFAPEPNIKENAGGLRDYHTALWLLMVAHDVATVDEASARGIITQEEHLDIVEAVDFEYRIRNELHFCAGKTDDRLTFNNQRQVAKAFEYDSHNKPDTVHLMQDYYAAASRLRRFLHIVASLSRGPSLGSILPSAGELEHDCIVQDGVFFVGVGDEKWFSHNPARLMDIYWRCARNNLELSRASERMVTANLDLINEGFLESDLIRRFFVAICNRPFKAGRILRQMSRTGVLGRYIPEFGEVEGVLRYEDFHHYPVDEHSLLAVEALAEIPGMDSPVGRCLREALENLSDPYILVMAILFHDLGKAAGEVHVAEGVRRTRSICERIGMPEEDAERITFLVEHHMLMNNISQYRDTDDLEILEKFADTIKTEQRLRALFLLSFCDLYAVGPNVWNDWKGTLLLQLYLRTVKRLLGRAETVGEAYWKSEKAEQIRALTRVDLQSKVEEHLQGLGQRYFVAFSPEQVAAHLECVEQAEKTGVVVYSQEDAANSQSVITVCTKDRHGLFGMLAGAFSSLLVDVTSAAVFTRPDGMVVDVFHACDARQRRPLTRNQLANIEATLRQILLENRELTELVEGSRRRLFALLQPRVPVPTRVLFDNYSSRHHTVIDVETGDRTGLLYDIVQAITDAGLEIATARIVTDARRVRDSFYVYYDRGSQRKVENDQDQEAIRDRILEAIHPRSAVETTGDST